MSMIVQVGASGGDAEDVMARYIPPGPDAPEDDLIAWANQLPAATDLGVVCTACDRSSATFTVDVTPVALNPNGAVHGGIVSAIADQCLGVVSVINAPRDKLSVTASLHGQFHRPALPQLTVRARLLSGGARLIFVEADIEDANGRRCSTFQATMAVGGAERRQP